LTSHLERTTTYTITCKLLFALLYWTQSNDQTKYRKNY